MEDSVTDQNRSVYSGATSQARQQNGNGAAQAHDEASRYAAWKESLSHAGHALADRAKNTARITNEYAHQEPWKLIGLGAAVGIIVGMLISSSRR
jgi:ElaB/YqjD/DUF883 family membrane-anchored ribosome-binding protein